MVATSRDVTTDQLARLQAMHARTFALDVAWAQHLEGSYIPTERLRRVDPARAPFPFLDNGKDKLVWDNHCNSAVVRWILREHGITLAGPEIANLVEPVSLADLRREGVAAMRDYATWARTLTAMSRWQQPYLVLTGCRILYTLETGEVVSKRGSAEWALGAVDGRWSNLIDAAVADRADPWLRVHLAAKPGAAQRTIEFMSYLEGLSGRYDG